MKLSAVTLSFVVVVFTSFALNGNAQSTGSTPPFNGTCLAPDLVSYLIVANAYKEQKLEPVLAVATKPETVQLALAPIVNLQEQELNVLLGCGYKSSLPVEHYGPGVLAVQTPQFIASYIVATLDREDSHDLLAAFFGTPAKGFSATDNLNGVALNIQSSHDEAETFLQYEAQQVIFSQDSF